MSHPCYRYPCDMAYCRGTHSTDPQLHRVRVGSGKYLGPGQYAWDVSVVADGDDKPWLVRLRVGKTHVDLEAGQELEDLLEYVARATLWQSRYVREDLERELKATELDLELAAEELRS